VQVKPSTERRYRCRGSRRRQKRIQAGRQAERQEDKTDKTQRGRNPAGGANVAERQKTRTRERPAGIRAGRWQAGRNPGRHPTVFKIRTKPERGRYGRQAGRQNGRTQRCENPRWQAGRQARKLRVKRNVAGETQAERKRRQVAAETQNEQENCGRQV